MERKPPGDPATAVAAARAPHATEDDLRVLARSSYTFVREYVAVHPNVTADILSGLVPSEVNSDGNFGIARAIARAPMVSAETLGRISRLIGAEWLDGSKRENRSFELLICSVAVNPNCPTQRALSILEKAGRRVREIIAQETVDGDVLAALLADSSGRVREIALSRCRESRGSDGFNLRAQ